MSCRPGTPQGRPSPTTTAASVLPSGGRAMASGGWSVRSCENTETYTGICTHEDIREHTPHHALVAGDVRGPAARKHVFIMYIAYTAKTQGNTYLSAVDNGTAFNSPCVSCSGTHWQLAVQPWVSRPLFPLAAREGTHNSPAAWAAGVWCCQWCFCRRRQTPPCPWSLPQPPPWSATVELRWVVDRVRGRLWAACLWLPFWS